MARDLRRYAEQTNTRLVIGFLLLVFLVGDGLIYLIYGRQPALLGLICLTAALGVVAMIWMILWLLDWSVRRARDG